MKHVGKMKNNSARVAIVYRTLPGDPYSSLVIGTNGLVDSYHDSLMAVIEGDMGQQTNELADILSIRRFPDGSNMLGYLHSNGHLVKVPTNMVLVTPDSKTSIPLNELNELIAKQKGVSVEDLAVTDGSQKKVSSKESVTENIPAVDTSPKINDGGFELSASEMRSRADALFKQAQQLRKQADEIDPPKKKSTKAKEAVE